MSQEYIRKINTVVEFIEQNLDKELNLALISRIGLYSPFHFHRLFTSIVGENPNQFITRKRFEKAAFLLKSEKNLLISDIAEKCGFSNSSSFTKAFKNYYGESPSFVRQRSDNFSKIRQINSKNRQTGISIEQYICNVNETLKYLDVNAEIEVKQMPAIEVAYLTHVGPFNQIGNAYKKLFKWAASHDQYPGKTITCYRDNPEITDIDKLRQNACIEISKSTVKSNTVNYMTVKEGKYAVGKFEIAFIEFEKAWQAVMVWVAEKGYTLNAEKVCYEIYSNSYKTQAKNKCVIEICVPVKPAGS